MSMIFGPVFQVAYVVEDLEAAVAHWTRTMGVGPFYLFPLPLSFDWMEVRGQRVDESYDMLAGVAMAYSGDTQIEIIQPGKAHSPYREFLDAGRSGVHHLGTVATDYDAQMAAARAAGITVALEGKLPISRFSYLDTDATLPGTMVELVEMSDTMKEMYAGLHAASLGWDGSNPIRNF